MGIDGLWKVVEDASGVSSLRTHTIREGFEGDRAERLYYLGIDASIWLQQMLHTFATGHLQSGENPELRGVFLRLAMLAERPIHAIFVADGPQRPNRKRDKQVRKTRASLTDGFRRLVEAYGFAWLEAAGEAEAELAKMNELGYIDAVMSEDSDTLVFGAPVVIRNPSFKRSDHDDTVVYRRCKLEDKMNLSVDDLFLYALLVGCDYDQKGLRGCGSGIARGLIRYGLGRSLRQALQTLRGDEFTRYLDRWRVELCLLLRDDPKGFIGHRCRGLAAKVPTTFPNIPAARLLSNPALLPPSAYDTIPHPRPINLGELGSLCELYFTWGNSAQILKTFRTTLWIDEVIRMLISEGVYREGLASKLDAPRNLLDIEVVSVSDNPAMGYAIARVCITERGFSGAVKADLRQLPQRTYPQDAGISQAECESAAMQAHEVNIPALIVERARPWLITPSYETTGYTYGRIPSSRETRIDRLGSSSLLASNSSRQRAPEPKSKITTPLKKTALWKDYAGKASSSHIDPSWISSTTSSTTATASSLPSSSRTISPLVPSLSSASSSSTLPAPFSTSAQECEMSSSSTSFIPRVLSPLSDVIDLTLEPVRPTRARPLNVIDLTSEPVARRQRPRAGVTYDDVIDLTMD